MRKLLTVFGIGVITAGLGCGSDVPPPPAHAPISTAPQSWTADKPLPPPDIEYAPAPGRPLPQRQVQDDAPVWPVKPSDSVAVPTPPPLQPAPVVGQNPDPSTPPSPALPLAPDVTKPTTAPTTAPSVPPAPDPSGNSNK